MAPRASHRARRRMRRAAPRTVASVEAARAARYALIALMGSRACPSVRHDSSQGTPHPAQGQRVGAQGAARRDTPRRWQAARLDDGRVAAMGAAVAVGAQPAWSSEGAAARRCGRRSTRSGGGPRGWSLTSASTGRSRWRARRSWPQRTTLVRAKCDQRCRFVSIFRQRFRVFTRRRENSCGEGLAYFSAGPIIAP